VGYIISSELGASIELPPRVLLLLIRTKAPQQLRGAVRCWVVERITGIAMKTLQIEPRGKTHLFGAMLKKQAEIRKGGRGTFSRTGAKTSRSARWTHVRYRGAINLKVTEADAVNARITSPDRGDEARLLSSFLGWLDRHFGKQISSVNIQYQ
jgi:hypothetical protein